MNIETANRLLNLRKENNLSQEALAERLGISRQAVSKWERAEASPDTDNLIALAKLYGMSLDDLLDMESRGKLEPDQNQEENVGEEGYVNVGLDGVHVNDDDSEVHVSWKGIHVRDKAKGESVDVSAKGVYVNGKHYDREWWHQNEKKKMLLGFPVVLITIAAYLIVGAVYDLWHPTWILFLLIPIWYTVLEAYEKRDPNIFAYPVIVVILYLLLGFTKDAWHPGWVLFITIPVYYGIVNYIKLLRGRKS